MTALYRYIKQMGINQNTLAIKAGINISRINDLCNDNKTIISAEEFYKIYKSLNITSHELANHLFTKKQLLNNVVLNNEQANEVETDFGVWIKSKIIKQKEICTATGIKAPRFSKLINNENTVLTALEFIKICHYLKYNTDQEFELLFKNKSIKSRNK